MRRVCRRFALKGKRFALQFVFWRCFAAVSFTVLHHNHSALVFRYCELGRTSSIACWPWFGCARWIDLGLCCSVDCQIRVRLCPCVGCIFVDLVCCRYRVSFFRSGSREVLVLWWEMRLVLLRFCRVYVDTFLAAHSSCNWLCCQRICDRCVLLLCNYCRCYRALSPLFIFFFLLFCSEYGYLRALLTSIRNVLIMRHCPASISKWSLAGITPLLFVHFHWRSRISRKRLTQSYQTRSYQTRHPTLKATNFTQSQNVETSSLHAFCCS